MSDIGEDGYPTEAALEKVRTWPFQDPKGLFEYLKGLWYFPEYFDGPHGDEWVYRVSTVGWSGNESLIGALLENMLVWHMYWHSSRRGGHYEFRLGKPK